MVAAVEIVGAGKACDNIMVAGSWGGSSRVVLVMAAKRSFVFPGFGAAAAHSVMNKRGGNESRWFTMQPGEANLGHVVDSPAARRSTSRTTPSV